MAGAQLCVDAGSSRGASGGQENSPKRPAGSSGQKNIVGDHGKENPVKKKKKIGHPANSRNGGRAGASEEEGACMPANLNRPGLRPPDRGRGD